MTAIKVNRVALIEALENAKNNLFAEVEIAKRDWEAYDKEMADWAIKVLKHAKTATADRNDYGQFGYSGRIYIEAPESLPKPAEPRLPRPETKHYYGQGRKAEYQTLSAHNAGKAEEIDNTLKLLKMSNEENVNASVYKSVVQYI